MGHYVVDREVTGEEGQSAAHCVTGDPVCCLPWAVSHCLPSVSRTLLVPSRALESFGCNLSENMISTSDFIAALKDCPSWAVSCLQMNCTPKKLCEGCNDSSVVAHLPTIHKD